ncbi:MAG: sel1 repeat family protein, partial [Rhodospirillaceae bacterium]|nr:sel1 repeat family protein [Rhodospirillaceae bacterium]
AAKLWRNAAKLGYAPAQNNLGYLYREGEGVVQDHAEALNWYRMAALQHHALAQRNLGKMYYKGVGVAKDFVEAYKWFSIASDNKGRSLAASQMNSAQIAKAHILAREWMTKHPRK